MRRHRPAEPPPSSSSSDEEDAFTALSNRKKRKRSSSEHGGGGGPPPKTPADAHSSKSTTTTPAAADVNAQDGVSKAPTNTSSNKRHHNVSSARAARMDALLQELQADSEQKTSAAVGHYGPGAAGGGGGGGGGASSSFVPNKKGSFVEAGEEHLTTNIFVGNLDPGTTEEELTDLFRQFGDLYSVKIMWPRTAEEHARNRNTGFVCFMVRADAQEAMDAFQDADPFHNGRRMLLRWGKNVKKTVKRGTGGVPIAPIAKRRAKKKSSGGGEEEEGKGKEGDHGKVGSGREKGIVAGQASAVGHGATSSTAPQTGHDEGHKENLRENGSAISPEKAGPEEASKTKIPVVTYDPIKDKHNTIKVHVPLDPKRVKFITTVASFVAKDGSILERKLIDKEAGNPDFAFLSPERKTENPLGNSEADSESKSGRMERLFYRWRVYSFCQGDGKDAWRTEPFQMFAPDGMWWVPPPLDQEAARREEELIEQKEMEILSKQEIRRKLAEKKDFMTGRQLEHAKFGNVPDEGVKLNPYEKEQFDALLGKLCASRQSICDAMCFCFDKSGAAIQISELLKDAVMDSGKGISIDTRVARLYLLSDILFNSQQPGVRNAFRYRDSIENMAPDLFRSLGIHGARSGRMTMNKMRKAVDSVLGAWTNWSVYNSGFIDDLHAHFEGKEVQKDEANVTEKKPEISKSNKGDSEEKEDIAVLPCQEHIPETVGTAPRGDWTVSQVSASVEKEADDGIDGEPIDDDDVDGEPFDGDEIDGEPLDDGDDMDGEPLDETDLDGSSLDAANVIAKREKGDDVVKNVAVDIDVDGGPLEDEDVDGEPLGGDEF